MLKQSAISSALLGVALILSAANDAAAQFQLSPGFGVYVPHGVPLLTENGASGETLRKQAVGGPVFTTRAGFSLSRLAAVEASLSYSPALIAVHSAGGRVDDRSAGLVLLSARSLFRLTPESTTRFSIHAASGVGMVTRIGNAWSDTPTKPAFALVLGAGAMAPLTPRGGTSFRIDLEDYLSFAQFELSDGTRSKAHSYHDLVWSLGLAIPISKGSGR